MSINQKEVILLFLKELISQIQTVEDSKFDALMSGEARLEFHIVPLMKVASELRMDEELIFAKNVSDKLHDIGTREQGYIYIESI